MNASLVSGFTDFAKEAIRRALERIRASAGLDATFDALNDATLEQLLIGAFQRAIVELLPSRNPADWLGRDRDQWLEKLARAMVDELRHPSGLDGRTVDHGTFRLDRHSIRLLFGQLWRCRTAHIQAALDREDYEDAAVRALACAATPIPLPAQMIADVLVGVEQASVFVALGRQIGPKDTGPLHDLIRHARLAATTVGAEQTALTLFLLWKLERPDAQTMLPHLRRLARTRLLSSRAAGWTLWLARQLGDSSVNEIYEAKHGAIGELLGVIMGDLLADYWDAHIDDVIESLPERINDVGLDGIPARAAPRTGRNEPCPCGSGKKFKRCCADKPNVIGPSAELARLDRLQEAAPRLDLEQIARLSRVDLALLELPRLRDAALVHLMRKQVMLRDWNRACLAVEEIERRQGRAVADGHLEDVVHDAFVARQYDVVERLLEGLQDATARAQLRADLDLALRTPEALTQLEVTALAALKNEQDPLDVAFTALHALPALGILIARGMLHDCGALDRESLADAIEEARDVLLLPPGDPATAYFETLDERETPTTAPEPNHAQLAQTTAELQAKLDQAAERLVSLQRQADERERELDRAVRAARERSQRPLQAAVADPRPPQAAADSRDQRALRDKIDDLQARIREGNEERASLRRQLSEAAAVALDRPGVAPTVDRSRADPAEHGTDDAESIPFVSTNRALLFPQFTDSAKAALDAMPRNVAGQAMRTVANLAAGDPAAWRIIKQAKDMRRQVLMARVGIHHRLLFRVENNVLDVLDVVTRESLLINLKRMRSG